ncbi:MAG: calcium/sodium antiporter [Deltaproteobacteria bacterium]|nr:calcium/sodium antiporter [Deltaproteobacteria bacterium]
MLNDILITAAGVAILVTGGELLVAGASRIARGLGVSPLVVGLTVVAFGTSAPELAVSVGAALRDSGTLAFGNVFGSNMANIGLIVGGTALIRPLPIENVVIRRELPMLLLSVAAAWVLAGDSLLGEKDAVYTRSDGLALLLFFAVFLYYTIGEFLDRRGNGNDNNNGNSDDCRKEDRADDEKSWSPKREILFTVAGLAALVGGAELTVQGGIGIARGLGVPEVIVGLTLVSVGTSLPELVAAAVAMRRGQIDIAVGGAVGSNIFNTLMVLGLAALVRPISIPAGGYLDLAATGLLSLALLLTARTNNQRILRAEGVVLLGMYLGYMVVRTLFLQQGAAGLH